MTALVEFKVSRQIFDQVRNDPGARLGFEAEFHVENASDLLLDDEGYLPDSFQTFRQYEDGQPSEQGFEGDEYHEDTVLYRLCRLFEDYLDLPEGEIEFGVPHAPSSYRKWKLTTDASLYTKAKMLRNPDDDIGVELVSPVMTLLEGLAWMAKVFQMISAFHHNRIRIYTTDMCSNHINLSHVLMEQHFDYAKLAILGGDEHYLADFDRVKNQYSVPILRAVYDELVSSKEGRPAADTRAHRQVSQQIQQNPNAALNLLNLAGWDVRRVMYDLSTLIPLDHHMSIDFRRLTSKNPYIEIRVAGNAGYERRYDEISKMIIRYGALIKIGCDPNAYRQEYLKKVYQLVSGVATTEKPQVQNPLLRIRIYLQPIMTRATRTALDQLDSYLNARTLSVPAAANLFLVVLRSALDTRKMYDLRVRQGLNLLFKATHLTSNDLTKALTNTGLLIRYGVLRSSEKPVQTIAMMTNAIKSLNQPVTRQAIMSSAAEYVRLRQEKALLEGRQRRRLASARQRR